MSIQKILDFYNHSSVKVHDVLHISHEPGTHYAGPTTEGHYGLIFTVAGNGKMQFNEAKGVAGNNSVFHGGPDCLHRGALHSGPGCTFHCQTLWH
ncbi:AraC family ligand binding domain-containing protein [Lacrimispora indolis]|uniref:AraC family ligand binding domain-containing protein n=1 Tax=Lacrimispora indolis TaxID=69825 RepID=UPI00345F5E5F